MKITNEEWKSAFYKVSDVSDNELELSWEDSYKVVMTQLILEMGIDNTRELSTRAEKNYMKFIDMD
jgi:hypothetical protein